MDLRMRQLITIPNVFEIPITDVVVNTVEKWMRINDLSHWKIIMEKRKTLFFLMLIWNTKKNWTSWRKWRWVIWMQKPQNMIYFMMGRLIIIRILIKKNLLGYYEITIENHISINKKKIKVMMNIHKNKITHSIWRCIILLQTCK